MLSLFMVAEHRLREEDRSGAFYNGRELSLQELRFWQHVENAAADRLEESDRQAREANRGRSRSGAAGSIILPGAPSTRPSRQNCSAWTECRILLVVVATALILLGLGFCWTIWMAQSSTASDTSTMQEVAEALRQIVAEQRDQRG